MSSIGVRREVKTGVVDVYAVNEPPADGSQRCLNNIGSKVWEIRYRIQE